MFITSNTAGYLNVGDQLLVCDGISLLDVTHDEAAQALKRAMDMESVCRTHCLSNMHVVHISMYAHPAYIPNNDQET